MQYGHLIETIEHVEDSGWCNALKCPHCGSAMLRFALVADIDPCAPTDDRGVYMTLQCARFDCEQLSTLVARQHAGIIHLSLTA